MGTTRMFYSDGSTPRGIVEGALDWVAPTGEEKLPRGEYHPDLDLCRGADGVWRQYDEDARGFMSDGFSVVAPAPAEDESYDEYDYSDFEPEEEASVVIDDEENEDDYLDITTGETVGSHRAAVIEGLRTDENPEWNNWKRSTRAARQWMRHKRHQTRTPRRRLSDLPTFIADDRGTMSLVRDHDDQEFCLEEEYFSVADGLSDEEIEQAAAAVALEIWIDNELDETSLADPRPIEDVPWSDWAGDMFDRYGVDPTYELYDDRDDEGYYNDALGKYESGPVYDWDEIDRLWEEHRKELEAREDELDRIAGEDPSWEPIRRPTPVWPPTAESWKDRKLRKQWQINSSNPICPLRAILAAA